LFDEARAITEQARQPGAFAACLEEHGSHLAICMGRWSAPNPIGSAWLRFREQKSGDRAADREWEATKDGLAEMQLRMLLRRIDRLNSALSAKLRVMEIEAEK
jgi:hypothetical protein